MFVSRAARTNSDKILADDSETMTETLERALASLLIVLQFGHVQIFPFDNLGHISLTFILWLNTAFLRTFDYIQCKLIVE